MRPLVAAPVRFSAEKELTPNHNFDDQSPQRTFAEFVLSADQFHERTLLQLVDLVNKPAERTFGDFVVGVMGWRRKLLIS